MKFFCFLKRTKIINDARNWSSVCLGQDVVTSDWEVSKMDFWNSDKILGLHLGVCFLKIHQTVHLMIV